MTNPLSPEVVHELAVMHAEDREWQRHELPLVRPGQVLAIDPGSTESAWMLVGERCQPLAGGKMDNHLLLSHLETMAPDRVVIEMVASYGMAVGAEVFETCVWIGRFQQVLVRLFGEDRVRLVKRLPVKIHLCHSSAAKDSNIRQALVDRFAPGVPNYGKGTKARPGWFHGFSADMWAAYALGVYAVDTGQSTL